MKKPNFEENIAKINQSLMKKMEDWPITDSYKIDSTFLVSLLNGQWQRGAFVI